MSEDLAALLSELAAELEATAELPVSPESSPWLGEATAVAEDAAAAAEAGADPDYLRERLGHVSRLLDDAGETGNDAADERVDAASDIADRAAARLDEGAD